MARRQSPLLTEVELRLMRVLWDRGEATVSAVIDAMTGRPKPAYNTVQTVLRILERKRYVTHRRVGRAFLFLPAIGRTDARRHALHYLLTRFFDNSPNLLALNLLEDERLSPEALEPLKRRIEQGR